MPNSSLSSLTASSPNGRFSPRAAADAKWLIPFSPPKWLRGGHAQTLAGNYWRRQPFLLSAEACEVQVDAADGTRVLCHCHWQPEAARSGRLTVLLVHGLEGSSDSRYIQGIAALAWNAGCNVIRMNMRNCGGTDRWTPTQGGAVSRDLQARSGRCGAHHSRIRRQNYGALLRVFRRGRLLLSRLKRASCRADRNSHPGASCTGRPVHPHGNGYARSARGQPGRDSAGNAAWRALRISDCKNWAIRKYVRAIGAALG